MNEKVYVVTNEGLHHDSSYYEVLAVRRNKKDAESVVRTASDDIIKRIDAGDFGDDFEDYQILFNEDECTIESPRGYFELWKIEEMELR